jgi:hypothetical protein
VFVFRKGTPEYQAQLAAKAETIRLAGIQTRKDALMRRILSESCSVDCPPQLSEMCGVGSEGITPGCLVMAEIRALSPRRRFS